MALQSNPQHQRYASMQIRTTYSNSGFVWAVIEGEPMKVQLRLKPVDTGYQLMYRLVGTSIELPYNSKMIMCRIKADCDPVIMEQNIINMLKEE